MAFFHIRAYTHPKTVSIGRENLCFFLSERRLKGGVGVSHGKRPGGRTGAFLRQNQHFSKPEKGGAGYGSFPHRKDQRLHGHVQLPPAGQVAVPESEGAAVPHAVAARGLGLHHEGLARICKDSIDSSSGGIRELEAHGYLIRSRVRSANGQLGSIEYTILEQPKAPSPTQENLYGKIPYRQIQCWTLQFRRTPPN